MSSEDNELLLPPPDIRGKVDKTAQYVAKNGPALENKLKQDHGSNPNFSFLQPGNIYYSYYRDKVQQCRKTLFSDNTEDDHDETRKQQKQQDTASSQQHDDEEKNDVKDPADNNFESESPSNDNITNQKPEQQELIPETPEQPLEPPIPLNFLESPAPGITHKESDLIKLVTQYVATYGRTFLVDLIVREENNEMFHFLKPQHGQFKYMKHLIMQYCLVRNYPLDTIEQLRLDATSLPKLLERIKQRSKYEQVLKDEERRFQEEQDRDRRLYSEIDWHDFEIVETIDYHLGDRGDYPQPTTADQVGTRYLMQQRLEEVTVPQEMDID